MADKSKTAPDDTQRKLLTLLEEFDKKTGKSNERVGCSFFSTLAIIPIVIFFFSGMEFGSKIGATVGLLVVTLVIFVSFHTRVDKRRLGKMMGDFNREFPAGSTQRGDAVQVLKRTPETKNQAVKKLLDQIPLAERGGLSAEQVLSDVREELGRDTFPAPVPPTDTPAQRDDFPAPAPETPPEPPVNRRERYIPLEIEPRDDDS